MIFATAVFAAWTEPDRLKQWWGPGFFETVWAQVDLRPGGRYELLLEPGSMRLVGEFREVTPPVSSLMRASQAGERHHWATRKPGASTGRRPS